MTISSHSTNHNINKIISFSYSGLVWLIVQRRRYSKKEKSKTIGTLMRRIVPVMKIPNKEHEFLSNFDIEVLQNKDDFYNRSRGKNCTTRFFVFFLEVFDCTEFYFHYLNLHDLRLLYLHFCAIPPHSKNTT